jgi:hypothetical protein
MPDPGAGLWRRTIGFHSCRTQPPPSPISGERPGCSTASPDDSWDTAPGLDLSSFAEHRTPLPRRPNSCGAAGSAAAYAALTATAASELHTLGSTAAAKALYALSPRTIMLWDAAIAAQLHGRRDESAFAEHLRLAVRGHAPCSPKRAPCQALVGRPSVPPAKILDEYLHVTITMRGGQSNGHGG